MTQKYKTLEDLSKIISLFSEMTEGELSVTTVSKKLAMSPSKVSRMLKTLEAEDFFEQNPNTGKYRLGFKFFELGLTYAFHLPLRKIIRPHIESLAQELKITASWGIINRNRVIVVDRIQSIGLDTLAHRIGANMPVHCTSIGRVLLAHLPNEEINKVLRSTRLIKYTNKSVVDPKLIKKQLKTIREKGFAFDDEETAKDIVCIAAPIKDSGGEVIAAINLTDNIAHTTPDQMMGYAPLLKGKALFISRQLGFESDFFQERMQ
jgi:IclR family transcriptional regulator, KDG regulon repressor